MNAFDLRLRSILESHRRKLGMQRMRLDALSKNMNLLAEEQAWLASQLACAAAALQQVHGEVGGTGPSALARFDAYVARRSLQIKKLKSELLRAVDEQRQDVSDAARHVESIEKLRRRGPKHCEEGRDWELDAVFATARRELLPGNRATGNSA